MPREEFQKLCMEELQKELIPGYMNDMKRLAISCDYSILYDTIDKHSQKISQRSFIELYKAGREYRKDAPAMWCPECETGISQVECVDKDIPSFFNDIVFKVDNNGKEEELEIATTRPELLPACVAVFYHPNDKRYQYLKGKKAKVPLFNFEVPIMEDERADPEKGTGIVMCCTFGDQTDMEWQKAHNLPIKEAITKDGRMSSIAGKYEGMSIHTARKMMIEDMKDQRLLLTQTPITHPVKVHERCGTEVEFIKSKQWFIKYLDLKDDMLKWAKEFKWYPGHMVSRYTNWVGGLQWDWLISRQRYFGIPFPVWYCKKCEDVILAKEEDLPVDPLKDRPPVSKCPKCGCTEIIPEKDVLDTWATSSLTPRLAIELMPESVQKKLYPMDLRPQAHDIITFWLFNTVVKSHLHYGKTPWKNAMISGWLLDPKGKKMSKSVGNIIEPQEVISRFCADGLRFMAAGSKLGEDLSYQEKDVVTGMKMITKMWNATKFALMHLKDYNLEKPQKFELVDRWALAKLEELIKGCTASFESYEYARTKFETEVFFYQILCDNYLEIAKDRLYNPDRRGREARLSAQYTLYKLLLSCIKMMAPIMPHITEAVYQLYFAEKENCKSVHISNWPEFEEEYYNDVESRQRGDMIIDIISTVRKKKSEAGKSLKEDIKKLVIECKDDISEAEEDIKATTRALEIEYSKGIIEAGDRAKISIFW
jgi:valyl-tRNA synthetase